MKQPSASQQRRSLSQTFRQPFNFSLNKLASFTGRIPKKEWCHLRLGSVFVEMQSNKAQHTRTRAGGSSYVFFSQPFVPAVVCCVPDSFAVVAVVAAVIFIKNERPFQQIMRQKVVTVSDKSRTSYEKCRKTKGKSTWAQNVHSNKLHVQKACTHTHRHRYTQRGALRGRCNGRQQRDDDERRESKSQRRTRRDDNKNECEL